MVLFVIKFNIEILFWFIKFFVRGENFRKNFSRKGYYSDDNKGGLSEFVEVYRLI